MILPDGSEHGKVLLTEYGCYGPIAQTLPPLVIGTIVQCINMPLVRATITIQNPTCDLKTVGSALHYIYTTRGIEGEIWRCKFILSDFSKLLALQPAISVEQSCVWSQLLSLLIRLVARSFCRNLENSSEVRHCYSSERLYGGTFTSRWLERQGEIISDTDQQHFFSKFLTFIFSITSWYCLYCLFSQLLDTLFVNLPRWLIIWWHIFFSEHSADAVCSEVRGSRNSWSRADQPPRRHQKRVSALVWCRLHLAFDDVYCRCCCYVIVDAIWILILPFLHRFQWSDISIIPCYSVRQNDSTCDDRILVMITLSWSTIESCFNTIRIVTILWHHSSIFTLLYHCWRCCCIIRHLFFYHSNCVYAS